MDQNGFILPLQLEPLFQPNDDQTILSPTISRRHLARHIGSNWFQLMEDIHQHVPVGTRLLIRRINMGMIVSDYISTRVTRNTIYGNWTHQIVVYQMNEVTPYPFDMDCFYPRDDLLSNYYNNNPSPLPVIPLHQVNQENDFLHAIEFVSQSINVNPLPEGDAMWVDENDMPLIFPLSPVRLTSSALLSSFNQ
jgi:hypothetical protein